ncbi:MFS transporter [Sphingomonas ginkgonis]|uniref:MFS transporter n=1 Tax=Sphingomonas ginkgonis TaxID=2315330 RepID=A0A3R9YJ70_9SPHN|nr:MFS transporter [Sphingomonas ginkgonis]RST31139.1 MFS transporter [Sphingomonas ginkgonis]
MATAPQLRKLPLATKLAYGFGSVAYGIKDNGFQTLLLLYYNQVVGVPAHLVGLAIMVALVIDAFVDPIVGHLSDHLRSRWGRRHPFMYAAALPVGLLYLLLWNPPTSSPGATVAWLAGTAILIRTAISCYEVPSSALAPELTADYHERTSVLGYRYLFGWIGGMTMLLLTFNVFLQPTAQYPLGQLNPDGYHRYALVAAIAMTLSIAISALGTHREIRHLPQGRPARTSIAGTFREIAATLRNRAFLILIGAGVFAYTSQGLSFALSTYFNTFVWGFPAAALGLFTIAVLVGVGLAFLLASRVSRRLGKRRTAVLLSLCYIIVSIIPLLLRRNGLFFVNGDPALMPVLMGFTALGTALGVGNMILGASMMSDVVEEAQERTGARSEGLFFAGSFFMQKCVSGLGLFLTGIILSGVGFPTGALPGQVSQQTLYRLIDTYCVLHIVLGLTGLLILSRFPITRAQHEQRVARLAETASHAAPLPGSEPEYTLPSNAQAAPL